MIETPPPPQDSEHMLRSLISHLPGVLFRCLNDPDWTMEYISQGCLSLTGFSSEELLQNLVSFNDIIHPEDRLFVRETIQKSIQTKTTYSLEFRIISKEQRIKWVFETGKGCFNSQGILRFIEGFIIDNTQQKEIAKKAQAQQNLLSVTLNSIGDGVIATDMEGRITLMNPPAEYLTGWPLAEGLNRIFPEVFHIISAHTREIAANPVEGVLEHSVPAGLADHTILISRDGLEFHISDTAAPIRDSDGNMLGVVVVFSDITQHYLDQEAIRKQVLALSKPLGDSSGIQLSDLFNLEEIQKIQDLFAEATGVASIITLPDGTPITRPSKFCRLCNEIIRKTEKGSVHCMNSDSILGRHHPAGPIVHCCYSGGLWDAGASITVGNKHIANWLIGQVRNEAQDENKMLEFASEIGVDPNLFFEAYREVPSMSKEQFEKVSNALFEIASSLSLRAYQNLQQARLINELQQAEDEALNTNQKLSISNAEKDKLFAIVAHDLRGPLETFKGLTDVLVKEWKDLPEKDVYNIVIALNNSSRHVSQLLEKLLEWSVVRRGLFSCEPEKINLNHIVSECLELFEESSNRKFLTIIPQIPENLIVWADTYMIRLILRNLFSNAIKFTPNKGTIHISAESNHDEVVITVKDTGVGMSAEVLHHLFQLDAPRRRRLGTEGEQSSGLGLLLSAEFVSKNRGQIWAESSPGQGSTFHFTLKSGDVNFEAHD